jgi:hypothetical protein
MKTLTITRETISENGLDSLTRLDAKYIELKANGKTFLRTFYLNNNGTGHFYYNDTKYKVEHFLKEVPEQAKKETIKVITIEGDGRKKEIDFNPPRTDLVRHAKHEYIKTCIKADIPVYLVGEAGTGKNYTLQEIAHELKLEFYFTNSVQQEYKVTGFIDAGGVYHETEFYKAFTKGGLFFLDEMDASVPEVLVLLNAAIANRYFEFPNGRVDAHSDFRVVAAGNTVGSGANELYTGRLVLDSASLDRFVVIEFDYDKSIELSLAKGNEYLVNFVRSLRDFSKQSGIRATFSYRCIINITKLEKAGMNLVDILRIAVVKGLDKDTVKTLKVRDSGRYYFALQELQNAA